MHFLAILVGSILILSTYTSASRTNTKIRPRISLDEIDKKTFKTTKVFEDSEQNLDVILDEAKLVGKKIELNCRAPYPVIWAYKGDGLSNMQVTTGVDTIHGLFSESTEFTSTGTVGFSRNPNEVDTGNYTCTNLQDNQVHTSYYVYVSGDNLFVHKTKQAVIYTEGDTLLRIPCSVSHPDVKLSLQKLVNGVAEFPLNDSVIYDPKLGFLLRISEFTNVEGTYLCNAVLKGSDSTEKISVIRHNAISSCDGRPCPTCSSLNCGENTTCTVFKKENRCSCLPGFTGNPQYGCFDLRQSDGCSIACGINTECHHNHYVKEIRCRCLPGFEGDPYFACQQTKT